MGLFEYLRLWGSRCERKSLKPSIRSECFPKMSVKWISRILITLCFMQEDSDLNHSVIVNIQYPSLLQ
ncbi:hypothetical protein MPTK1_7g07540 [Marchantia polymorpha subsp. ruderalis]|uniref:Uncharacterized protein n=2 Tax=Marchantia polymorpha TaxID=3197 RepID=A0AAF6BX48_MARPO|nr:hypothetical protein MARPO_0076s0040 [Marchantia polymorpha]BBN16582.1 hypothetical protein Mp_7g07540 [Marchantia polymorpha subsp. ruderalis]|eukprot:PTQ34796.1 hypothetical protein MARPO_0076s0040 [Marchantia polymorpha]